MKVIANFGHLLRLAAAVGKAKREGDPAKLVQAQAAHDEYRAACLAADEMDIGETRGSLAEVLSGANRSVPVQGASFWVAVPKS